MKSHLIIEFSNMYKWNLLNSFTNRCKFNIQNIKALWRICCQIYVWCKDLVILSFVMLRDQFLFGKFIHHSIWFWFCFNFCAFWWIWHKIQMKLLNWRVRNDNREKCEMKDNFKISPKIVSKYNYGAVLYSQHHKVHLCGFEFGKDLSHDGHLESIKYSSIICWIWCTVNVYKKIYVLIRCCSQDVCLNMTYI